MKLKKIVSLILAVSMMLSVLSSSAFAQSNDNTQIIDLTSEPADEMKPTPTPTGSEPEPTSETQPTPTPEPINTAQPTPSPEPTEPGSGTQPSPTPTAPADTEKDAPKPASLPQSIGDDEGIMPVYNGDVQDGVFTVAVDGIDMTFEILTEPSEGMNGTVQVGIGEYDVAAIDVSTYGHLNIPSVVEVGGSSYHVISIGENAFQNCINLTSVTIPDSITSIGSHAFYYCSGLTSLAIPNSVTTIGTYAFSDCNALEEAFISDNVTTINEGMFSNCISLTKITIPNGVSSIGVYAFANSAIEEITIPATVTAIGDWALASTAIIDVEIPNNVISIGDKAFSGCMNLSEITIPGSVTSIGEGVFNYCINLSSIVVVEQNMSFSSNDGILFNKDKTELIKYPAAKQGSEYIISASVAVIGEDAFGSFHSINESNHSQYLSNIFVENGNQFYSSENGVLFNNDKTVLVKYPPAKTEVEYVIPDSVETINDFAFNYCSFLQSISLSENLNLINLIGIENCDALNQMHFKGNYSSYFDYIFSNFPSLSISHNPNAYGWEYMGQSFPYTENDWEFEINNGKVTITNYIGAESNVTVPDIISDMEVEIINDYAFSSAMNINTINIGSNVKLFNEHAFASTFNLTDINVSENNTNYASVEGVLLDKDKDTLLIFPQAKTETSYTILESVTTISRDAFSGFNLNIINFHENVTTVMPQSQLSWSFSHFYFEGNYNEEGMKEFTDNNTHTIYYENTATGWENIPNASQLPDTVFEYNIINGEAELTSAEGIGDVVIPDYTDDGYPITSIGWNAFEWEDNFSSVTIGNNVTTLDGYSFGNTNIPTLILGNSVSEINEDALSSNFTSIVVPIENQYFSTDEAGILFDKNKTELIFAPNGLFLEEYTVPESVLTIGSDGFGTASINTVIIDENVSTIDIMAFNMARVNDFNISQNNLNYASLDGILTNKEKTEIIIYPRGRADAQYEIPEGITNLNAWAFTNNHDLTSIVIGKDVNSISHEGYDSLVLPFNLKEIIVDLENTHFSSEGGVLFNKDKTELISYPPAKQGESYTILDTVSTVGSGAFDGTQYLRSLTVSNKVEKINIADSMSRSSVESITFGTGLMEIFQEYSVYIMSNLTSVHFKGGYSSNFEDFFNKFPTVTVTYDDNAVGWENKGESWPKTEGDFEYEIFGGDIAIARYSGSEAVVNVPDTILGLNVASILSFGSSHTLSEVNIGSGIDYIDESAFDYSWNLQNINVVVENLEFSSNNGALLNKDGTHLIKVPTGRSGIYSVPNGVESIGKGAFIGNVNYVTITENVTQIEEDAFTYYYHLHTILFDVNYSKGFQDWINEVADSAPNCNIFHSADAAGWEGIDNVQPVLENPFLYEDDGESIKITKYVGSGSIVVIPDEINGKPVTTIELGAFGNASWITSIDFGNSVEVIPNGMLSSCSALETINIGDSVVNIGNQELRGRQLKEINVSKNNTAYSSQDGVLFNKNATELLSVTAGRTGTYIVPKTVEKIGEFAFLNTKLTHLEIPGSVKRIDGVGIVNNPDLISVKIGEGLESVGYAVFSNSPITEIAFPSTVESIEEQVLFECYMLERVYFDGDYNSNMQPGLNSISLAEAQVYYNPSATGWEAVSGAIPLEEYQYEETGEAVKIVKYLGFDREVVVPSEINGKAVTAVEDGAFSNCINIDSLILPNSITQISGNFFGESTYGGELFIPLSNTYLKTYFDSISVPYTYLTEVVPETEGTATEELKPEIPQEDISNIFTNEEIEASEETSIAVKLTVDKMEESAVPAEETAAIEAKIQEYQETLIEETVVVAEIIDITLTKTVGSTETDITELNKPIKITIDIPEEHKASNRTYVIVRVHEGVAEILEDLDDNPDTITFETGKFSTYGIAYSEGDYLLGDVNKDGILQITDVMGVYNHMLSGELSPGDEMFKICDFNGSGTLEITDVMGVYNTMLAG